MTDLQLFEPLDAVSARDIVDRIKERADDLWQLITRAYMGRAWLPLGYSSWDALCAEEFRMARLRLPQEERAERLASLRESGLSIRAIASAAGQSIGQTHRDLTGVPNGTPVTGVDGKRYRSSAKPEGDDIAGPFGDFDDSSASDEPYVCPRCGGYDYIDGGEGMSDQCHCFDHIVDEDEDEECDSAASEWQPSKPDLGDGVSHPARFSSELIPLFADLLRAYSFAGARVLDPFAGPGGIHELYPEFDTVGIEIEKEWADLHERTQQGSALDLPFDPEMFDAIVTSPTYGNRLADSHNARDPERRRSYTHDLGHELHDDNSGDLHWRNGYRGSEHYRTFHERAWMNATVTLKVGGVFILNIKDHWRDGRLQLVPDWHCWCLGRLGLDYVDSRTVGTRNLRQGANGELRSTEEVYIFRKTGIPYAISHWMPS